MTEGAEFVVARDPRCAASDGRSRCFLDAHGPDVEHLWLSEALALVAADKATTTKGAA